MTKDEAIQWLRENGWPNAGSHPWNGETTIALPLGESSTYNGITLYAGVLFITKHQGAWLIEEHHMLSRSFPTLEEACREALALAQYLAPWMRTP